MPLKIILDYDDIVTSQSPFDTHFEEVIGLAKFDIYTPGSFGRVKTNRDTDRITLYTIYLMFYYFIQGHWHKKLVGGLPLKPQSNSLL